MLNNVLDKPWKKVLATTSLFIVIILLYTFPLITQFNQAIPGYGADLEQYYWCDWWFGKAVGENTSPWYTDYLWYPNGTPLVFSTNRFVSSAVSHLFKPLFGDLGGYNFALLLGFLVTALGIYLLVTHITKSHLAGFLAGFIFTFNPARLHRLMHHHNILSVFVFGFCLYLLYRILNEKGWHFGKAALLGLLIIISLYETMILTLFLVLMLAFVFFVYGIFRYKKTWDYKKLVSLALGVLLAGVLSLPMLDLISDSIASYGGSMPEGPGKVEYSHDLLHLLSPSPLPFTAPGTSMQDLFLPVNHTYRTETENFGMPGWPLIIGIFTGWFLNRKTLLANMAFAGTLLFFILSLGPKLWIGGKLIDIPMPFALLQNLPFFSMTRTPNRFVIVGFVFAAILLGMLIKYLLDKKDKRFYVIGYIAIALIIIDYMPHGIDTYNIKDVPESVKELRDLDLGKNAAVLHLNINFTHNLKYAVFHKKPISSGYTSRTSLLARPLQDFSVSLVQELQQYARQFPKSDRIDAMVKNVKNVLDAWNIRAILQQRPKRVVEHLAKLLGGEMLTWDHGIGLIKLGDYKRTIDSLTISADTWPRQRYLGLEMGEFSQIMWTDELGFYLAIPDNFMYQSQILLNMTSSLHSDSRFRHSVLVFVNRELVGKVDIGPDYTEERLFIPGHIKRRPVNIIAVRNLVKMQKVNKHFPFSANIVSANTYAGNTAALSINGKELLPHAFYDKTLFFATSIDGKSFSLHEGIRSVGKASGDMIDSFFSDLDVDTRFLILFHSGNIGNIALDRLEKNLAEPGIEIFRLETEMKSFVLIADLKTGHVEKFSSEQGIVNAFINMEKEFSYPVLNIKRMDIR